MDDITSYYLPHPPPPPPSHHHHDTYAHYHPPPPHSRLPYTQQQQQQQQQSYPVRPSHSSRGDYDDDVRTLFIAGLPANVKNRELYNLFREFPGFVSTNLRPPSGNSQAFAFAVFADQQSAVVALRALNGMVFDLEEGSTLYIDLAKSNSRSKRQRPGDERIGSKKHKTSLAFQRGSAKSALAGHGSLHSPGMDNSHYNMIGYPSAQSHLSFGSKGDIDRSAAQSSNNISSPIQHDKSPCATIFVGNLGPKCSEQELHEIFSSCEGFLKLKFRRAYGAPAAFVDFKDTACSTEVLNQLQGTILPSSPAGEGMRLEYAKSRMRKRKSTSK